MQSPDVRLPDSCREICGARVTASEINPIGKNCGNRYRRCCKRRPADDWLRAPAHYRTDTHGCALITVLSTFARFPPCNCSALSPMVTIARSSEPLLGCLFRLFARLARGTERRPWHTHTHTHTHHRRRWCSLSSGDKNEIRPRPGSFLIYRREYGSRVTGAARREDYRRWIRDPITRAPGINSTPVIRVRRVQFEEEVWRMRTRERERERENIISRETCQATGRG